MKSVLFCAAASAALLSAAQARAQQAPEPDAAGRQAATEVERVVVTATRTPETPERIGQAVIVLDRETIESSQAVAVSDLLSQTPGVSLSRNGGPGAVTTIRIRGAEGDQTTVVIDGVKVNDPSTPGGGFDFGDLLTGDIARIEVLRGAQSTLWGSQAIGGVVNVVTADPAEPFEARLEVEGGSRETGYLRAAVAGAGERLTWRLAANHLSTDGVSAFRSGAEADGYRNTSLSGRARLRLTDALSADLRAAHTAARIDQDGFPPPAFSFGDTDEYGETERFVGYAGLNLDLLDGRLRNRLAYGYTEIERKTFDPGGFAPVTFDGVGENRRLEYQGVLAIAEGWTATGGLESEESRFESVSFGTATRAEATINSGYVQLQAEVVPALTLTGGVRRDEHETFGGRALGQLAAAWRLNDGATVLRASYGQGFKAPTLFQLYSDFGNLGLEPETADTFDVSVEQRFGPMLIVSATAFARQTEDQIDFVSCFGSAGDPLCTTPAGPRFGYYGNIAKTSARGLELSGGGRFAALNLQANYTWTETENESPGPNRGRALARRPDHQANLWATYVRTGGLSTTAAVRYVGEAFDDASNVFELDSYTLVDLRASYPVSETVELYGRVENLTDEDYETVRNYGSPGRSGFVGVRARF
jgi:vitamin B12 transporter